MKKDKSQVISWILWGLPLAFSLLSLAILPPQVMVFWQGYPGRLAPSWEILIASALLALATFAFWGALDWMAHSGNLSPIWLRIARSARMVFTIIFFVIGVIGTINAYLY